MADRPILPLLAGDFLRVSRHQMDTRRQRIEACLAQLTDAQIWARRHDVENAVGNLVLHLCGNIEQWIVGGVGGKAATRDRDAEFDRRDAIPAAELAARLRAVVSAADAVLGTLTPEDLAEPRSIQGYDVTVLHAVYHVVEHLAEHTGQIIWATKGLTGRHLGFYDYLDDAADLTGRMP